MLVNQYILTISRSTVEYKERLAIALLVGLLFKNSGHDAIFKD